MNTKQITAWTLAMFMGFAFAAPGAMAGEEITTIGNTNADGSSSNVSDPSGEPGNQGGAEAEAEASDGSQGNAGGDTHGETPPLLGEVGQRQKQRLEPGL